MTCIFSKCAECKHFHNDNNPKTCNCDAFPDGIPFEKWKAGKDEQCTQKYMFEPEKEK